MPDRSVVFTRWEHGGDPVVVTTHKDGSRTFLYDGEEYSSARSLLKKVTGRHFHHTFDQYFETSILPERLQPPRTILDLFGKEEETEKSTEDELITKLVDSFYEFKEAPGPGKGLGVDLSTRGHEVRKLLFKTCYPYMKQGRYDPDDVLQEIYKGLLTRNKGKCPWDADKSTFGYYVTMVCRGVLFNYHAKAKKRKAERDALEISEEVVQIPAPTTVSDAGSDAMAQENLRRWLIRRNGGTPEGNLAPRILPLMLAGYNYKEIGSRLGVSPSMVSKSVAHIRECSREWAEQNNIQVPA